MTEAGDFDLPTHCLACGVPLAGGQTRHREGCAILKLIRQNFPGFMQPSRALEAHCAECGGARMEAQTIEPDVLIENETVVMCGDCGALYMVGKEFRIRELNYGERKQLAGDHDRMGEFRGKNRKTHFARAARVN